MYIKVGCSLITPSTIHCISQLYKDSESKMFVIYLVGCNDLLTFLHLFAPSVFSRCLAHSILEVPKYIHSLFSDKYSWQACRALAFSSYVSLPRCWCKNKRTHPNRFGDYELWPAFCFASASSKHWSWNKGTSSTSKFSKGVNKCTNKCDGAHNECHALMIYVLIVWKKKVIYIVVESKMSENEC